ncbi:MAG: serine hydrolase [Candidatus Sungiibacteriota bacterium]
MILKSPYWALFGTLVAGIAAGMALSVVMPWPDVISSDTDFLHREKTDTYQFINPLLWCGIDEDKEFGQYQSLKKTVNALIAKKLTDGDITNASLYFRELDNGRWFGINENDKFSPASLLKVARAIAYYKLSAKHPEMLTEKIIYTGTYDNNQMENLKGSKTLVPGQSYTAEELIGYMIQYSDNNATRLLDENMDRAALQNVYTDLDIPIPDFQKDNGDFLSVKSYSYFWRVLYNATYVRKSFSEKILGLLVMSDFTDGMRAGVPQEISIAHKFGEREMVFTDGTLRSRELHDCGIVYDKRDPYFLCVMTKGNDFKNLAGVIRDINAMIFNEIHSNTIQ